jgi:ribosomal-protein-alanine N-acetyltransferase
MLTTERLVLTPVQKSDARQLQHLFGDPDLVCHALNVPRSSDEKSVECWMENLEEEVKIFAIRRKGRKQLIGVAALILKGASGMAEYTYLIGIPFWGKGYGTEAAKALLALGFEEWNLSRIYATSVSKNLNSRRELEKVGMKYEGCLQKHVQCWGEWEDLHYHGILRQQYLVPN